MYAKVRLSLLLVSAAGAAMLGFAASPQTPAASTSGITRKVLQTVEVPGSSYQVIEAKVEIAANAHIPKHTHPGTVVGYVLTGDYSIRLDGQAAQSVGPGQSFVVPSGVAHEEMTGAHAATILAVFTVEKGKPLSSPAP